MEQKRIEPRDKFIKSFIRISFFFGFILSVSYIRTRKRFALVTYISALYRAECNYVTVLINLPCLVFGRCSLARGHVRVDYQQ